LLLKHVRNTCRQRFVFTMFAFAAHTGARRSELLRSQVDDFDFAGDMVTIREKKKDRSKDLTFRSVPMSPFLRDVMHGKEEGSIQGFDIPLSADVPVPSGRDARLVETPSRRAVNYLL
jgi:integrase